MFVYSGLPWTTIGNECTQWRRWLDGDEAKTLSTDEYSSSSFWKVTSQAKSNFGRTLTVIDKNRELFITKIVNDNFLNTHTTAVMTDSSLWNDNSDSWLQSLKASLSYGIILISYLSMMI